MVSIVLMLKLNGKQRLSSLLTAGQRQAMILFLFERMLSVLEGYTIYIATPDILETRHDIISDQWGDINKVLSKARQIIAGDMIILPCDLPFVEREEIETLTDTCVTIVPSQDGGTNALYLPENVSFETQFGKSSFNNHIKIFESLKIPYRVYRSDKFRDIDSEADISWSLTHEQDSEFSQFFKTLISEKDI